MRSSDAAAAGVGPVFPRLLPSRGQLLHTRVAAFIAIFAGASITDWYDSRLRARSRRESTTRSVFSWIRSPIKLPVFVGVRGVRSNPRNLRARLDGGVDHRPRILDHRLAHSGRASKGASMPAQRAGKFKTTSQMVGASSILVVILTTELIVERYLGGLPARIVTVKNRGGITSRGFCAARPYWLTFVTSILTIFPGYLYLRANMDLFEQNDTKKNPPPPPDGAGLSFCRTRGLGLSGIAGSPDGPVFIERHPSKSPRPQGHRCRTHRLDRRRADLFAVARGRRRGSVWLHSVGILHRRRGFPAGPRSRSTLTTIPRIVIDEWIGAVDRAVGPRTAYSDIRSFSRSFCFGFLT